MIANFELDVRTLTALGKHIVSHLRANGFTIEDQPNRQALAMAEEVGEFVGAFRRWTEQARQSDTEAHVIEELADVVITSFVTAAERGWDLDMAIRLKAQIILNRGWRT